jgi:hypothetical protein
MVPMKMQHDWQVRSEELSCYVYGMIVTKGRECSEIMLKRRKATVVSSTASTVTPIVVSTVPTKASSSLSSAVATSASSAADSTFEKNVKFLQGLQNAPASSSVAASANASASTLTYSNLATQQSSQSSTGAAQGAGEATPFLRTAAGKKWEDKKLAEFDPEHNFCLFVGDLGNECTDEMLASTFGKYPSFVKARVIKDALTQKNKGYGFVAYRDAKDYVAAMRELNGKYVGNRPVKLRKATFEKRVDEAALARLAKKNKQHRNN